MESFENVRVRREALTVFITDLFERAGVDRESAQGVARAVVDASARAFDTHGVRLVPHYLRTLEGGRINRQAQIRVTRPAPAIVHVDADDGFGHPASYRAIDEGIATARDTGVAAVTVGRSSHHGATGCYTIEAARQGFAAIGMTNADAIMVPHDGLKPFHGTNPLSFAVPVAGEEPLLLDMATSSIPLNRIFLRRATGTPLPPEVAVDEDGVMTTDPHRGAAVLPLGGLTYGYKGAGLACMVDVLCSAFTGMAHGYVAPPFGGPEMSTPTRLGHFFIVLQPDLFQPLEAINDRVGALLRDLRRQPSKPGTRVMAPGDPEKAEMSDRAAHGIPIDPVTWLTLQDLAGRHGLKAPTAIGGPASPPTAD
jgi:ureidoglycolate dehydrogenase (NAD+)